MCDRTTTSRVDGAASVMHRTGARQRYVEAARGDSQFEEFAVARTSPARSVRRTCCAATGTVLRTWSRTRSAKVYVEVEPPDREPCGLRTDDAGAHLPRPPQAAQQPGDPVRGSARHRQGRRRPRRPSCGVARQEVLAGLAPMDRAVLGAPLQRGPRRGRGRAPARPQPGRRQEPKQAGARTRPGAGSILRVISS